MAFYLIYLSTFILSIFLYVYIDIKITFYRYRLKRIIKYKLYKRYKDKQEYIYCFRDGIFIKIGRTTNLIKRLQEHQISHATTLHILAVIPVKNSTYAETYFHRKFIHYRYKREFFVANPFVLLDMLILNYEPIRKLAVRTLT